MPTTRLSNEDAEWIKQHKHNIEKRNNILKNIGVFLLFFTLAAFAFVLFAFVLVSVLALAAFAFVLVSVLAFAGFAADSIHGYDAEKAPGAILGIIVGLLLSVVFIVPSMQAAANLSAYPMQLQVFYPNHPNLTITQNCSAFTTSSLGYLNGQPIDKTNTTACLMPQAGNAAYQCSITNKTIYCVAGASIWEGTILNVSKRR